MKYLLLGLMLAQPHTLYELHGRFARGLQHIYAASYGSVHRALTQLHTAGHIARVDSGGSGRSKKVYETTPAGRELWAGWMKNPQSGEDGEASMLARVFLLNLLPTRAERHEVLSALHDRAVTQLEEMQALDTSLSAQQDASRPREPATMRYSQATVDHGLRTSRVTVDWLGGLMEGTR